MGTQRHASYASEPLVTNPRGRHDSWAYRTAMGMVPSYEYLHWFDDFIGTVTTNVPQNWAAAITDTTATITTGATATTDPTGDLVIAGGGSASFGASTYLTAAKPVQLTSGKKFYMEVFALADNVADMDLQFGLTDLTATANPEDLWTTAAANLAAFGLLAGSAYPTMLADAGNTGTTAQAQTVIAMADSTASILAIGYDGANLTGWVDGTLALTWSGVIPTGVALTPFIGARCGTTTSDTARFDYARMVIER